MKSDLTESLGKSLAEIEKQDDGLPKASSDLDYVVLRTKSTTSNQGRPRSMLCNSVSEIRRTSRSNDAQKMKRHSEVGSWNGGNSMNDETRDDSNIIKSPSLQKGNTTSWISPFSQRKLKKTRSVLHMQSGKFNNPNCEMGPKNGDEDTTRTSVSFSGRFQSFRRKPRIEVVFGNNLENVPLYSGHNNNNARFYTETCGLPEFVVRCIERIESMISTVGIYRINGDASLVEKIKNEVNRGNYKTIERCKSVSALTSALKLFLRELPQPLIEKSAVESCLALSIAEGSKWDNLRFAREIRKKLGLIPNRNLNLIRFIFLHLKRIVDNPENKMNSSSLAIIFGQNLTSDQTKPKLDIEGILLEAEKMNLFIEMLISFADDIFAQ